jgi:hypothetical protein
VSLCALFAMTSVSNNLPFLVTWTCILAAALAWLLRCMSGARVVESLASEGGSRRTVRVAKILRSCTFPAIVAGAVGGCVPFLPESHSLNLFASWLAGVCLAIIAALCALNLGMLAGLARSLSYHLRIARSWNGGLFAPVGADSAPSDTIQALSADPQSELAI